MTPFDEKSPCTRDQRRRLKLQRLKRSIATNRYHVRADRVAIGILRETGFGDHHE